MASTPMNAVIKFGKFVHVALYRMSKGRFANRIANLPILLLTSTGRKSGKQQTTPVVYIKDGDDYLVSASMGGMDWNPAWYHNLKANPQAKIEVGDKTFNVNAVITEGEERTRLYEKFKTASENFVQYEQKTSRVIPVIRLRPT
jgi:deazaflavin-dependent oxidoreductase (nitroreductase family)